MTDFKREVLKVGVSPVMFEIVMLKFWPSWTWDSRHWTMNFWYLRNSSDFMMMESSLTD